MGPEADELRTAVEEMWSALIGTGLEQVEQPTEAAPGRYLSACCQITGGWTGAFTIDMPFDLARSATATMFGAEPGEIVEDEVTDAIGELANVAGGMLKGHIEQDCTLGLPTMFEGTGFLVHIPGARVGAECAWAAEDHSVLARLHVPR